MKLASLRHGRDGMLVVVSRDLKTCVAVPHIAPTFQRAIDDWAHTAPRLMRVYDLLNENSADGAKPFDPARLHGAAAARLSMGGRLGLCHACRTGAQGARRGDAAVVLDRSLDVSGRLGRFHRALRSHPRADEAWGIDFEAEVAVITDDVPMGVDAHAAEKHIKLLMLVNDVSLRNLIPAELAKNFGFFQSKPASAFSPVAVTPDELGEAWKDGKVHLPLTVDFNGMRFGAPNAGEDMTFSFPQLIAHAAKTRVARRGHDRGFGHGLQQGSFARLVLHRRTAHAGTARRRRAQDAVHEIRRPRAHRNVRLGRQVDLRRDRPGGRPL